MHGMNGGLYCQTREEVNACVSHIHPTDVVGLCRRSGIAVGASIAAFHWLAADTLGGRIAVGPAKQKAVAGICLFSGIFTELLSAPCVAAGQA